MKRVILAMILMIAFGLAAITASVGSAVAVSPVTAHADAGEQLRERAARIREQLDTIEWMLRGNGTCADAKDTFEALKGETAGLRGDIAAVSEGKTREFLMLVMDFVDLSMDAAERALKEKKCLGA